MSNVSEEVSTTKKSPLQDNINNNINNLNNFNLNNNNNKNFFRRENKSPPNIEFKEDLSRDIKCKFKTRKEKKDLKEQTNTNNLNNINNYSSEKDEDHQRDKELEKFQKLKEKNLLPIRNEIKNIPRLYKKPNLFPVNFL